MELLLLFAFLSGLVTIFAPCIWPLLPIILSASTSGGHRKPLGITLGIMTSFALLTLTISYIVKIIPFDPNTLRYFAVAVIGFLGLTLVIPALSQQLEGLVSRLSGKFGSKTLGVQKTGFGSGYVTGFALGILWTPCAGPILATIATLAATQAVNLNIVLVTLSYIFGVGIPLFIFATGGQFLLTKTRVFSPYTGRIQQIFGVIMLLTALSIATNYDKVLQAKLLDAFPSYASFITQFENNAGVKKQLDILRGKQSAEQNDASELFNANAKAPDFVGITKWLNTPSVGSGQASSLQLSQLRGKVVLVDFWTYTCINCIRTLPHVKSWYTKYKDQGFTVIGVHTPEFEFEKKTENVLQAIKQYNITYPVAQDNDYATWNNFNNQYWPAEYLIDANGKIRRTHFGEGEYEEMEMAIQLLLKEAGKKVTDSVDTMPDQTPTTRISPETYLGSSRMQYYYPAGSLFNGKKSFTLSESLPQNTFSLGGEWEIASEYAKTGKNAVLTYNFSANKVFLVLRPGSAIGTPKVRISLDGKILDEAQAGVDVKAGILIVDTDRLYHLIDLHGKNGSHILKLEFLTPEIEAFAFTFG